MKQDSYLTFRGRQVELKILVFFFFFSFKKMYNIINIISSALCYIKLIRVNPKKSHHTEQNIFLFT